MGTKRVAKKGRLDLGWRLSQQIPNTAQELECFDYEGSRKIKVCFNNLIILNFCVALHASSSILCASTTHSYTVFFHRVLPST